jgi:2-(1,2-epoxy-1,2-dihydrophenyl)acetyl-CoA isomerase
MACLSETVEGGLVHLRLDNPAQGNVLDIPMIAALADAIGRIDAVSVRAVLISAAGRNFSVGGDLKGMAEAPDRHAMLRQMADVFHTGLQMLDDLGAPVVVAVNGAAAGGGLSVAMAGDIILGAASSSYMMAYTAIGLSPDGGASYRLPRLVGLRLAQEMAYLGRKLDAAEALAAGLITRIVPDAVLLDEALALARRLAEGPTGAFRQMKRLFDESARSDLASQLAREARAIAAPSSIIARLSSGVNNAP